jgi:hypothetical protein
MKASAGHAADVPVQLSATSQPPEAARHCVPAGTKASAGQLLLVPLQVSATSQPPAEARHVVPFGRTASGGHAAEVPVQVSAMSQPPATAARHVAPALPTAFEQTPELHWSTVHAFESSQLTALAQVVPQLVSVLMLVSQPSAAPPLQSA